MTRDHDFDRLADAWMAEGPMDLADNVLFGALDEIRGTRQRRSLTQAWRPFMSNSLFRTAAVIAVVVGGGLAAVGVARSLPAVGTIPTPGRSGMPVATAPAETGAAPSATPDPSLGAPLGYDGPGTIAFSRTGSDGVTTTWMVDPDGTNETPLRVKTGFAGDTELSGVGCCAVFSPDGRTIAVGFEDSGGRAASGTVRGTALLSLNGLQLEQLPVCGACAMLDGALNYEPVAWSPALNRLAVRAWRDSDPRKQAINIIEVQTPGGSSVGWAEGVTGGDADIALGFSPDGTRLLFLRPPANRVNAGTLFVLDIGSGRATQLSPDGELVFADGYFGNGATWSPDGSRVAYTSTDASGNAQAMRPWIVRANGGDRVSLGGAGQFVTSAQWSPDGSLIAFDGPAGDGSGHDLYVVAPDGTGLRNLTPDFAPGVCCARWSPDSRALLTAGTDESNERSVLYIVPVDGSTIRQVTTGKAFYTDYSWGPASR
jgi:WD40 repeat protein